MDVKKIDEFTVGQMYSSEEIQHSLGVGNAGGVRVALGDKSRVRRIAIMTAAPSARQARENPYHDRLEGNILVYTGAGLEGEQTLAGVNKRLPQQLRDNFPIYCFLIVGSRRDPSLGPRRWKFLGLLEYLRHYPDTQVDTRGTIRKVWLFEFQIHEPANPVRVAKDLSISAGLLSTSRDLARATDDEAEIAPSKYAGEATVDGFDFSELESVRSDLLAKSPEEFEHFIKDLMMSTGFERVTVTKFSQDGGIDLNALAGKAMWAISQMHVQIQAKRWLHTVGRREVAELRGSLEPHAHGAIVTTSHYSKAAIAEATAPGKSPIVLIDGHGLAGIVKHAGLATD